MHPPAVAWVARAGAPAVTPDDLDFLASDAGRAAGDVADGLDFGAASRIASVAAVRAVAPDHHAAVVDLVLARRRAAAKIRGSADWLLTDEAVQQATPWPVAAARAERLAGRVVHDVTCSIGADLTELARRCDHVVGSDLDPVRARMAAHNVPAALVARADALHPVSTDAVVVADPARRAGGRRLHDPAELSPPLPALLEVMAGRDLVVKCAPGLETADFDWRGEREVVSLDGAVKEACLWSPGLAGAATRRATVLRTDAEATGGVRRETVLDTDPDDVDALPEAEAYLVDPDGAIVRSGLVRHWAHRHGLRQLDPRIAHLTGPQIPPGYSAFPVLSRHRLDRAGLRKELRRRDCGSLEILVRGVDVDPDRLRAALKPSGRVPLALVVTRIGRDAAVFVCGPREHRPAQR